MKNVFRILSVLAAGLAALPAWPQGLEWRDTEVQLLHGGGFREPGGAHRQTRTIATVAHADGWRYGRNFAFADFVLDRSGSVPCGRFYGEAYTYANLGRILGDETVGPLRAVSLVGGVNGGTAADDFSAGPLVWLYGVCVEFKAPGFAFLNLELLRHEARHPFGGASWQCTLSWKRPFEIGREGFSLEGFVDHIGAKGPGGADQLLTQPQLRWDLGRHCNLAGRLWLGVEYHYWNNKYGIDGLREDLLQGLAVLKF